MSSARGTSPAFQLYAFDLMAKRDYRVMALAERGLLLTMWCECWANKELPANPDELAALLGKPGEVQGSLTSRVLAFFVKAENGTLISPDMEAYRETVIKQRANMSEGGSKGGKKRVENEKKAREASRHLSVSNQGTLKGRESESGTETESESGPATKRITLSEDPWVNDYERASNGY